MNPYFSNSNIENSLAGSYRRCYDLRNFGIGNSTNSNNFSDQNILTDCSLNGSVPFNDDNNFMNKTIERPKIYRQKENYELAVPCIGQRKAKNLVRKVIKKQNYCVFCYNNNEPEENYRSHIVRDEYGIVICPILRLYVCPICSETGDNAHTVKYCPKKKIITLEETLAMENYKNVFKKWNSKPIYT